MNDVQSPPPADTLPIEKHYLAAFFFSFMWGSFGVDRFYLGKVGTGILKLVSFGGFGIWALVDFVLIASGSMKDKWDRPLLQVDQYKKLAARTVLWFAIIMGLVILVNGLILIFTAYQLISQLQGSGMLDLLNAGATGGPSADQMKQLQQLGL